MEWTQQNSKSIAGVLTFLLVFSLFGGIYYWDKSGDLTLAQNKSELKADSLLSVKLNLEREIVQLGDQLNAQLTEAKDQNRVLSSQMASIKHTLRSKDAMLNRYHQISETLQSSTNQLDAQIADLQKVRTNLQAELTQIKLTNEKISSENYQLKAQLTAQTKVIEIAKSELAATKLLITADNFRVDVLKPNTKVTAKAKKANELVVSFNLPMALKSYTKQEVFMSITDLNGNPMKGELGSQVIKTKEMSFQIPVYATTTVNFDQAPQKVKMTFKPTQKVAPGEYRISIYTLTAYLGSTEVSLRNSFLFF
ncbi:MAG: hypothetical protein U0Y10_09245 [Spirosomataceae bacterium]